MPDIPLVGQPPGGAEAEFESAHERQGEPGQLIPGIALIRLLARGGFAEVWEAEQVSLGRRVAVKILRHELLEQDQMVQLFEQEAVVLARLSHPNVVQVIDRGTSSYGPYFVMEYVEGETLQDLLSRKKLSRDRALSILLQAARGLAYAHRNKVIHRDVKPANILVGRTGQVKLSDFGIAAVRHAAGDRSVEDTGPQQKQALGTRAFMAPEQRVSFDRVGPEADVYSLGVALHRIVTGKLPQGPGVPASDIDAPDRIVKIVRQALAFDPEQRFRNAGEFRESLINALGGQHLDDRTRRGAASTLSAQGRFELLDVIRVDEMRAVYLVRRGGPQGQRMVAKRYIKDPSALKSVRSMLRVNHPHVVRIHAIGELDDSFVMLMEHLPGGDLRERLAQPHDWRDVARVGLQVAQALEHTAKLGIVHGNLRPSNILFDEQGSIRVTDFGLREHYMGRADIRNWYAAPEGERSHEGDLYALGAIMYEMLFAMSILDQTPGLLSERRRRNDVPPLMLEILTRLLAERNDRYQTASDVRCDMEKLLENIGSEHGSTEALAVLREVESELIEQIDAESRPQDSRQAPQPSKIKASLASSAREAKPQATEEAPSELALSSSAWRATSLVPSIVALGGLVGLWLLQQPFVQRMLEGFGAGR